MILQDLSPADIYNTQRGQFHRRRRHPFVAATVTGRRRELRARLAEPLCVEVQLCDRLLGTLGKSEQGRLKRTSSMDPKKEKKVKKKAVSVKSSSSDSSSSSEEKVKPMKKLKNISNYTSNNSGSAKSRSSSERSFKRMGDNFRIKKI